MESNKLLKVTSILLIIFGCLDFVGVVLFSLLSASVMSLFGFDGSGIITRVILISQVGTVIRFVGGILGVINAAKPEKAMVCIVFGCLAVLITLIGVIITITFGGGFLILHSMPGLVLPVLYLIGAFQNKNKAAA